MSSRNKASLMPLIGNFHPQAPALSSLSAVKFHLPMMRFPRWVGVTCLTRQNLHWTPFFVRSIIGMLN